MRYKTVNFYDVRPFSYFLYCVFFLFDIHDFFGLVFDFFKYAYCYAPRYTNIECEALAMNLILK